MASNNNQNTLEITSRFMQNFEQKSTVSNHNEIGTGTDSNGKVMFFSVGDDNNLYLYQQDTGTANGWKSHNLTKTLNGKVHHFAVAQDTSGAPIVALSLTPAADTHNSLIYHTKDFSENNDQRWIGWGSQPQIGLVQKFAVGTGSQNNNTYIAFSALKNQVVDTYFVDANSNQWTPNKVELPENAKRVYDLKIGHHSKYEQVMSPGEPPLSQATVYTLFEDVSGNSQLVTETIPGAKRKTNIPVDNDVLAIGLTPDNNGDSNLFVGGKNLYFYNMAAQSGNKNTPSNAGAYLVGQFDEPITTLAFDKNIPTVLDIWARTAEGNLYVAHQQGQHWSQPIIMAKQVSPEITTWKNPATGATDLYYIDGNKELFYLRQDPKTTIWKRHFIKTTMLEEMEEIECYSIQIKIYDSEGKPQANQPIAVSASEVTQVLMNKKNYYVDSETWVNGTTDAHGRLTILNRIDKISSPHFRIVNKNLFEGIVEIMPYAETKSNLNGFVTKMKNDPDAVSNQQVSSWNKTQGKMVQEPLLTGDYKKKGNVQSAQHVLSQLVPLTDNTNTLPPNVIVPVGQKGKGTLVTVGSFSGFNNRINTASLSNYKWGLDFTGSSPAIMNGITVDNTLGNLSSGSNASGGLFGTVEDLAGDVFNALKNEFLQIKHFMVQQVEDGIQIIINAAEGVFNMVVKFAEQAWQAIEFVLQKVLGFVLKMLIKLLGFLFDWEAILKTKEAIVAFTNAMLEKVENGIESVEDQVSTFFTHLEDKIVGQDTAAQLGDQANKSPNQEAQSKKDTPANHSDSSTDWVFNNILNGGILDKVIPNPFDDESALGKLTDTFTNLITEEITTAYNAIQAIVQDLTAKVGKASFGEIADDVIKIFVKALLEEIKNFIIAILKMMDILVQAIQSGINKEIDIPIISWVYKLATGNSLTFIDGFALLFAIPMTILNKFLMDGANPFDDAKITMCTNSIKNLKLPYPGTGNGATQQKTALSENASTPQPMAMEETASDPKTDGPMKAAYESSFSIGGIGVSIARLFGTIFTSIGTFQDDTSGYFVKVMAFGTSLTGFAMSVTNVALGITYGSIKDKDGNAGDVDLKIRTWVERSLTVGQVLFPALSFLGIIGKKQGWKPKALGVPMTILGFANVAFGLALLTWQWIAKDSNFLKDGAVDGEIALLGLLKGSAFPISNIDDTKAKIAFNLILVGAGLGTVGLNSWWAAEDLKNKVMHRAF